MSGLEMMLRKHLGRYRWFRKLTRSLFGWYWRRDPLKEARRHLDRIHSTD